MLLACSSTIRSRLADLEQRGIDVLSRYDVQIAHAGNAEQTLATARWLIGNHMRYYERQLMPFEQQPRQADFFAQLQSPTPNASDDLRQDSPAITTP